MSREYIRRHYCGGFEYLYCIINGEKKEFFFCKHPAIERKLQRMAVVVSKQTVQRTTTTVVQDKNLLTHEQALKLLAGVLSALRTTRQDVAEWLR